MAESLRGQTWRFIRATFPERQVYIRSDGRVQFFTFGPLMQTILAGITLAFLGWVAFTSVNVIFKDRIIATKERRFQQMQAAYEARVTDLQLSYDQLNAALVTTADRYRAQVDTFQAKQQMLADVLQRRQSLQAAAGQGAALPPDEGATTTDDTATAPAAGPATDSLGDSGESETIGPPPAANPATQGSANTTGANTVQPSLRSTPVTDPRVTRPTHASFLEGAVQKLGALFSRRHVVAVNVDLPALHEIDAQRVRVAQLEVSQKPLVAEVENNVQSEIDHLAHALRVAGIDFNNLVSRESSTHGGGMGGPLIPLAPADVQDESFNNQMLRITTEIEQLEEIVTAMHSVPLTVPVQGPEFDVSSGFGSRVDPFTHRLAFHAGLDFTGPWGAIIHATASGVVVYAGPRGPYGNAVEIDHGYGIRTRYGHLRSILVQVGTRVERGTPVGRLGSSGRSTGPHVHYEVWYDDTARDPGKFIEAGRYVLKE